MDVSPQLCREYIDDYFLNIPVAKKKSEFEKYENLKKTSSVAEIATGLSYLQTHGIPISGAPCHSPMGFLSVGMPSVLKATESIGDGSAGVVGKEAKSEVVPGVSFADLVARAREKAKQAGQATEGE